MCNNQLKIESKKRLQRGKKRKKTTNFSATPSWQFQPHPLPQTNPAHTSLSPTKQEAPRPRTGSRASRESFCLLHLAVFGGGVGRLAQWRLVGVGADLAGVRRARALAGRVLVQVVKHLAQDGLEGAEGRTDGRRAKAVGDETGNTET